MNRAIKGQKLKTLFCWYLPSFVTKLAKPRVMYDGSAVVDGLSLTQAVLSDENLLLGGGIDSISFG